MAVFGKIVGGTIGLFLGGPFGAFAGAVFGHRYDRKRYTSSASAGPRGIRASYAALNCSATDSDESIRKQYRKLVFACHPDIIAAKELSEESVRLLTEKFIEIRNAYEIIRLHRGWVQPSARINDNPEEHSG